METKCAPVLVDFLFFTPKQIGEWIVWDNRNYKYTFLCPISWYLHEMIPVVNFLPDSMTNETTTILPLQIVHTVIEYTNSSCVWSLYFPIHTLLSNVQLVFIILPQHRLLSTRESKRFLGKVKVKDA